jgi:xanthine/uracil permease
MELLLFVLFLVILGTLSKQFSLIYAILLGLVFGLLAAVMLPLELTYKSFKKVGK